MNDIEKSRRNKHWQAARWISGLIVASGAILAFILPGILWPRCPAASLVSQSFMRQAATALMQDAHQSDVALRSIGILLAEDSIRGTFGDGSSECFSDTDEDVIILGHTLHEIRSGSFQLERLKSESSSLFDAQHWEPLGRFLFSHDPSSYACYDSEIIVGLSSYEYNGVALVSFADIHVIEIVSHSELHEIIELDRAARIRHGLSPLIDIEQEIADYRARKNLEPLRD